MFLNLHREKRLADQRRHDAMCVAKLDCLLRGQYKEATEVGWSSSERFILLPIMMIALPFYLAVSLLKGYSA